MLTPWWGWLAEELAARDRALEAGDLDVTGGSTAAIDVGPGEVYRFDRSSLGPILRRAD
jgi:2-keto-4-pentenoate hydratase